MKANKFLVICMSVVTLFAFLACEPKGPQTETITPTAIQLSATTIEVEVGATTTLAAVLVPSGATGTITWASSDPTICIVNEGVVTGVKEGTAIVSATCGSLNAMCAVTVKAKKEENTNDFSKSLAGSDYYLMVLDGVTYEKIKSKVAKDFRPNDVEKWLYVWENTYAAGTASGPNFYGEVEGWTCMTVTNVGWSGCGFFVGSSVGADGAIVGPGPDLTAIKAGEGWVLHLGMKSQDNATHTIVMYGGGAEAKIAIGSAPGDGGIAPYCDFKRNGEWQEIEIPMDKFFEQGLLYREVSAKGENVLAVLSGAVQGTMLNLDACFIYKPAK